MSKHIAVDIGGTQIRAALYSPESNQPERITRISTRGDKSALERICDAIQSVWPQDDAPLAIGMAAAGPTDPYLGIVKAAPNIEGWIDVPLKAHIENTFHVPTLVGNDANLAALGEWQFGAGRGHHHLIYLTVSTGIGGGVICADRLLLGVEGLAAELGHVTVEPGGPLCGCGQRGHIEAFSSGTGIANFVAAQIAKGVPCSISAATPVNARLVSEAAQKGDPLCQQAFSRAGYYLGIMLANLLHVFNPTLIILGGGVINSGDLIMAPTLKSLNEHVLSPHYLDRFQIAKAALGDSVGLMGALALARSHQN